MNITDAHIENGRMMKTLVADDVRRAGLTVEQATDQLAQYLGISVEAVRLGIAIANGADDGTLDDLLNAEVGGDVQDVADAAYDPTHPDSGSEFRKVLAKADLRPSSQRGDGRCDECGGPLEGWSGEHHSQQCSLGVEAAEADALNRSERVRRPSGHGIQE